MIILHLNTFTDCTLEPAQQQWWKYQWMQLEQLITNIFHPITNYILKMPTKRWHHWYIINAFNHCHNIPVQGQEG